MNINTATKAFLCNEIITIDPGKSNGGIVRYSDRYESWPLKKFTEYEMLVDFFKYQYEINKLPVIFIEKITTFQNDHGGIGESEKERNTRIGRSYQLDKMKRHYSELISAIKLSKINYIEVMPSSWQKYIGIHKSGEDHGVRKKRYIDFAKQLFQGQNIVGWSADAFLLVEFARKKLKYDQRWIREQLKKTEPKEKTKKFW